MITCEGPNKINVLRDSVGHETCVIGHRERKHEGWTEYMKMVVERVTVTLKPEL